MYFQVPKSKATKLPQVVAKNGKKKEDSSSSDADSSDDSEDDDVSFPFPILLFLICLCFLVEKICWPEEKKWKSFLRSVCLVIVGNSC